MSELKKEFARRNDFDASPTKRDRNDVDGSPTKRDRTGMLSASSPMKQIRAETEISALATTCAITHTVHGKVVAVNPRPVVFYWRGQRLLKYNFVLGAPDGVVEVSIIGQEATTLCSRVLPLLGNVVRCEKVAWDGPRKQFKFGHY